MSVQQQPPPRADAGHPGEAGGGRPSSPPRGRPNLAGDLNTILDEGPAFSPAMRGYDRMQVDNYVAWAETELRAANRMISELLTRLAASEAERHRAQQLLAHSDQATEVLRLSDRVADLLRMAAEEAAAAAAARDADAAQADQIITQAREQADLIVRRARHREAHAAARALAAEQRFAEAQAAVEHARTEVSDLLEQAAADRDRLEAEAAARLARAQQQLLDLHRRQDHVQQFLGRLAREVDAALNVVADERPTDFSFGANRAGEPAEEAVPSPNRA
jgi:colicin import membrane protein